MISHRTYITIVMICGILFFMFQFSGVMKEQLNNCENSHYVEETDQTLTQKGAFRAQTNFVTVQNADVMYLGKTGSGIETVASSYAAYRKQKFYEVSSLAEYESANVSKQQFLIIDGVTAVRTDTDVLCLKHLAGKGRTIVFARLPEYRVIAGSRELRKLLGIYDAYSDQVQLNGVHLFSGFLLGGEALYEVQTPEEENRQDFDLLVPWYVTGSECKTYMVGTLTDEVYKKALKDDIADAYQKGSEDEQSLKNSLLPAMIWRNNYEGSKIFCINGDFLTDDSGTGILTAIASGLKKYSIYPVINAQNFVVCNFPVFASENEQMMQQYYSQSAQNVYKDVVWSSIISLVKKSDFQMSCMMTPQLSYDDDIEPEGTSVSYYLKLLNEEQAEAGWSATSLEQWSVKKKLQQDQVFWKQYAPDYRFASLYVKDETQLKQAQAYEESGVKTIVTDAFSGSEPVVGYGGENLTVQHATDHGTNHTFRQDFELRCRETALGYTNIVLDLYAVTYPESEQQQWQNLSKTIAANVSTYWEAYRTFSATTLSESDRRIRRFLALDYTQDRKGDTIRVKLRSFDTEAYFMLRLKEETVVSVTGGSASKIEDGAYLIKAEEPKIEITVKKKNEW